jgi:hypothetical protein
MNSMFIYGSGCQLFLVCGLELQSHILHILHTLAARGGVVRHRAENESLAGWRCDHRNTVLISESLAAWQMMSEIWRDIEN